MHFPSPSPAWRAGGRLCEGAKPRQMERIKLLPPVPEVLVLWLGYAGGESWVSRQALHIMGVSGLRD